MMEDMGTGAARLHWDNFCSLSTQAQSVLEFLLKHRCKSFYKAYEPKPDHLQKRSFLCWEPSKQYQTFGELSP